MVAVAVEGALTTVLAEVDGVEDALDQVLVEELERDVVELLLDEGVPVEEALLHKHLHHSNEILSSSRLYLDFNECPAILASVGMLSCSFNSKLKIMHSSDFVLRFHGT